MKLKALIFLLLSISVQSLGQQYRPMRAAEIFQKMQQLKVMGTVMYVAAHPDDENTRLLSYLVHHDHVRTVYLSLTRGDGGQNILGREQGSVLGLIRTHELIEARHIDGAEQLFTNVIDFGFTKSPEETFRFWDKEDLARQVQLAFDLYRPDVVITRFPTTGEGGHGQHTASAIIAEEVFQHPRALPEGIEWQPTRLLFNAFRFGDRNTTSEDQFKTVINQYDPLLGEGYGEIAGRSRSVHKSQGAGTAQTVGLATEYFKLIAGKPVHTSLYDDIDMTWNRVGSQEIGGAIQQAVDAFDFKNPSASIPDLLKIRKSISKVQDTYWRMQKLKEVDAIILSCAGIMAELVTDQEYAAAGDIVSTKLNVIARSDIPVMLQSMEINAEGAANTVKNIGLKYDSLYTFNFQLKLHDKEATTEPYWMKSEPSGAHYYYDAFTYKGLPEAENQLAANLILKIGDELLRMDAPLSNKKLDPVKGDVVQQLKIVPPVSVEPQSSLFVFEKGKNKVQSIRIRTFKNIPRATLAVMNVVDGANTMTTLTEVSLSDLNKDIDTLISISIPTGKIKTGSIIYTIKTGGKDYARQRHVISYPHLPELQYFSNASSRVIELNWQVKVQRIGYVEGAGDFVADVLQQCGLNIERIPANTLNDAAALRKYDAIVVGVRAFNTQGEMGSWMQELLKYTEQGGNLIVQYNTARGLLATHLGPYPITLSGNRVTDEKAEVTITDASSPLLNYPNKIKGNDFSDWVQERGIYYPGEWDPHYKTMMSMHDSGEQELNSGILYTPYGKGHFIYTSLAFFRQLPAGNPGAIRLMMNMLSAGR